MPGDEVQVSARVSPEERNAIRAHGGLVHLIRKFLADNATEEEAIKLDVGIVGFTNRIEALASREGKKSESGSQKKREKELRLLKKGRRAHWIKSPKEWERENKLSYLMQYAAAGKLKQADEECIVQKMKWLNLPTKEEVDIWIAKGFEKASGGPQMRVS